MTTPAPVQLPLTRQEFLKHYGRSRWESKSEMDFEAEMDGHDLTAFETVLAEAGLPLAYAEPAPAPPPEPDGWEAAAQSWKNAATVWRRVAEIGDVERKSLQQRIDALLGALAERTRERDLAIEHTGCDLSLRISAETERDAAHQEAAELRRRCEAQAKRVAFYGRSGGLLDERTPCIADGLREIASELTGTRPAPGSEGGSSA